MRITTILLAVAMSVFFSGCDFKFKTTKLKQETLPTTQQTSPNHVTVFVDRSISVNASETSIEKQRSALRIALQKHIINANDEVLVCFIYGNTSNPTNRHHFVFAPPAFDGEHLKGNALETAKNNHPLNVKRARLMMFRNIEETVFGTPDRKQTHVLETLEVLQSLPMNSHVLYLSDMIESSSIAQLKLDGREAQSEVIERAQRDLKKYEAHFGVIEACEKVQSVHVVLPSEVLDETAAYRSIESYWEHVFEHAGIHSIIFS